MHELLQNSTLPTHLTLLTHFVFLGHCPLPLRSHLPLSTSVSRIKMEGVGLITRGVNYDIVPLKILRPVLCCHLSLAIGTNTVSTCPSGVTSILCWSRHPWNLALFKSSRGACPKLWPWDKMSFSSTIYLIVSFRYPVFEIEIRIAPTIRKNLIEKLFHLTVRG